MQYGPMFTEVEYNILWSSSSLVHDKKVIPIVSYVKHPWNV